MPVGKMPIGKCFPKPTGGIGRALDTVGQSQACGRITGEAAAVCFIPVHKSLL
jgi:hypothetical protein